MASKKSKGLTKENNTNNGIDSSQYNTQNNQQFTSMQRCKKCGQMISSDLKVCPYCGKKQKGKKGLIIGIILVAIIILGIAGSGGGSTSSRSKENELTKSISIEEKSSISDATEVGIEKENEDANTPAAESSVQEESTDEQVEDVKADETVTGALYSNAEIIDLMNGPGTEKIGTFSMIHAKQSDCTEEALADWYFNYVLENTDCNYHLVVYDDLPDKGVYSNGLGFIQKDVEFSVQNDGIYMIEDDAGSTYYVVDTEKQTLTVQAVMADAETINSVAEKVDAAIPDDYKNSGAYAVDVAGEEGHLDCNLTLVSDSFANADYQNIATEIGTKVKELDLGIGYFNIAFQSDENTLIALAGIDDLNVDDLSGITITVF